MIQLWNFQKSIFSRSVAGSYIVPSNAPFASALSDGVSGPCLSPRSAHHLRQARFFTWLWRRLRSNHSDVCPHRMQ